MGAATTTEPMWVGADLAVAARRLGTTLIALRARVLRGARPNRPVRAAGPPPDPHRPAPA